MSSNEYMRKYMIVRYRERKQSAEVFLGGKCTKCGSIEQLEFDHKDRSTKGFTIAKLWSVNEKRFWEEVKKCQLLCKKCHNIKTITEQGKQLVKGQNVHGTLSSYKYCKCTLCRKAKSDWYRAYTKNGRIA